eukprot:4602354-Amphidinium_carterae.1
MQYHHPMEGLAKPCLAHVANNMPESYPMWPGVKLAQLVKELYGLLPGPASWRYTLLQEAKRLGFIKHGVCPCLLCFPEPMVVDVDGRYIKSCRKEDNGNKCDTMG